MIDIEHYGDCVGGPWDGKLYVHWDAGPIPIYKPMMNMTLQRLELAEVEPVEIGRYEWHHGKWLWVACH
jgi:hypothetical protein